MKVESLRPALSGLGAFAGLASGAFFGAAGQAYGQDVTPASKLDSSTLELPATNIEGAREPSTNALKASTGLDRLADPLQSTPQTVTVIPQVVIEQQQATTIDQVLKYVPGVTVATGEGNGGMNGDAFRIRGFDAKGDIYIDGLRDFGAYTRDDFATENVQVFKGSSSESFGNGTTGGAINLQSKTAQLGDFNSVQTTLGQGAQKRIVADFNKQINDTTALRLVAMWHDQDMKDRDHIYSKRWGMLGSLGFGLGTDQTFTINYMHQHGDRRPDLGVPIPSRTDGGSAKPVTEYGVSRSSFFGKESDRDVTNVDMLTLRYHNDVNDWLSISNDTRFARYTRRMVFTPNLCMNGSYFGLANSTCNSDVLSGKLNTAYTVWPVYGDQQTSYGGQNITTANMRFNTGSLRHEATAGIDLYYQRNKFESLAGNMSRDSGTLLDPIYGNPDGFSISDPDSGQTHARSWDAGIFASDRMWLTDTVSVLAGLRGDSYHARSASWDTTTNGFAAWTDATTNFWSPKASLIWEPTSQQSYYISYARSFTPQGANPTYQGTVSQSQPNLDPDKNRTLEVGGKWSLLQDRLGLTAALFRVDKNRGGYSDPLTGATVTAGEKDRVKGLELGATGKLTSAWDMQASYTYMDSKILASTPTSFDPGNTVGNHVPYVSRHNVAIWSTYDVAPMLQLPGKLLLGGGMNYRSTYYADPSMHFEIPNSTTFDGLASYEIGRYRVALNVTNLTNRLTYASAFYYRAEVAPGRTAMLSTSVRF